MMTQGEIFASLSERAPVEQVSRLDDLLVLGDPPTLDYLQREIGSRDTEHRRHFLVIEDPREIEAATAQIESILSSASPTAILVASTLEEDSFATATRRLVAARAWSTPVVRLFADLMVNLYLERDPLRPIPEEAVAPSISYAVITTPRTGSEYLCQLLSSTGIAGLPEEHLRQPSETLSRHCGFDPVRFLRLLMGNRVTPNRVFGTKLISHFLHQHLETCAEELKEILAGFQFVRLVREDKLEQAISVYVASHTKIWHLHSHDAKARYEQEIAHRYRVEDADLQQIDNNRRVLENQESWVDALLEELGARPLIIRYEGLIAEPRQTVERIVRHLGIAQHYEARDIHASSKKLGSAFSLELKQRFETLRGRGTRG